jgi:predicted secreted hydrolase
MGRYIWAVLFPLFLLVPIAPGAALEYREALPGYHYQFPQDHFEHEDFRTEWWYYTGNVTSAAGERFGFELVFFREGERQSESGKKSEGGKTSEGGKQGEAGSSPWTVNDLYLAHAALTDARGKRFLYDERLNRAGPGIAGASFNRQRVWNGNWWVEWSGEAQTLEAVTAEFRFHLALKPEKPFVIEGLDGISQKAPALGRASYYVSFPLLAAAGTIESGGRSYAVTGRAWMDHEWFTGQLAPDQVGWDWFSVQLDNRTELMLFELRRTDGSIDPYSSGTYVDESGVPHHLRREQFSLEPQSYWGKYPVAWRIRVPSLGVDLTCRAVIPNQELKGENGGPSYWEGAVDYAGSATGVGYLEMTGYDRPVKLQ